MIGQLKKDEPTQVICSNSKLQSFIYKVITQLAHNYAHAMAFPHHTLMFNKEGLNHTIFFNREPLVIITAKQLEDAFNDTVQAQITFSTDFCIYVESEHEQTFITFIRNQLK